MSSFQLPPVVSNFFFPVSVPERAPGSTRGRKFLENNLRKVKKKRHQADSAAAAVGGAASQLSNGVSAH